MPPPECGCKSREIDGMMWVALCTEHQTIDDDPLYDTITLYDLDKSLVLPVRPSPLDDIILLMGTESDVDRQKRLKSAAWVLVQIVRGVTEVRVII